LQLGRRGRCISHRSCGRQELLEVYR
jgi:hypothetical protein